MATFMPVQAMIGGTFIGAACGIYMLFAGRVAGNSGVIKEFVKNGLQAETTKIGFLLGLCGGGALMGSVLPQAFEAAPAPSLRLAISGLLVGLGTFLGNGCTSGHGLCGLSRCSIRSMAAVPTFMAMAIMTSTALSGSTFGGFLPVTPTPDATIALAGQLALALAAALVPLAFLKKKSTVHEAYTGLWTGATFAVGLTIGGMVRPSVVTSALSPSKVDLTLWVLFVTGLLVTFGFYRLAAHVFGVKEASAIPAAGAWTNQAKPDMKLVMGASLFGLGWGSSGMCPGPHLVSLAAAPATSAGGWVMLAGVSLGMSLARVFGA